MPTYAVSEAIVRLPARTVMTDSNQQLENIQNPDISFLPYCNRSKIMLYWPAMVAILLCDYCISGFQPDPCVIIDLSSAQELLCRYSVHGVSIVFSACFFVLNEVRACSPCIRLHIPRPLSSAFLHHTICMTGRLAKYDNR